MKRPRPGDEAALWECVVIVIVLAAIVAVTSLLAWLAYLLFCYRPVIRTSDSASLKHAAVAARTFRSAAPAAIAQTLIRLLAHARR